MARDRVGRRVREATSPVQPARPAHPAHPPPPPPAAAREKASLPGPVPLYRADWELALLTGGPGDTPGCIANHGPLSVNMAIYATNPPATSHA